MLVVLCFLSTAKSYLLFVPLSSFCSLSLECPASWCQNTSIIFFILNHTWILVVFAGFCSLSHFSSSSFPIIPLPFTILLCLLDCKLGAGPVCNLTFLYEALLGSLSTIIKICHIFDISIAISSYLYGSYLLPLLLYYYSYSFNLYPAFSPKGQGQHMLAKFFMI